MNKIKQIIFLPAAMVGAMVAVFIVEVLVPGNLSWLGIRPRSISGVPGILLSPFLHADVVHLVANAVPLLIMGSLVSALAPSLFIFRTTALVVISGVLTWMISSSGLVIGASGLVFAYWTFLMTNGVMRKRIKDICIAILTFIVYGTLIFGLLRVQHGVSWAGHFSGAIAGFCFAFMSKEAQSR